LFKTDTRNFYPKLRQALDAIAQTDESCASRQALTARGMTGGSEFTFHF
jgi:hypothetical protein